MTSRVILPGRGRGPVLAASEPLSFWGGVDPASGVIIDAHHPLRGATVTGRMLALPTSRGSCSGSGVLLDLILSGRAPAVLVFREAEEVLTLGALVADELFGRSLPVVRLGPTDYARLITARDATLEGDALTFDGHAIQLAPPVATSLALAEADEAKLAGTDGPAVQRAMRIICRMAALHGSSALTDVVGAHIDGCIYASPANLAFAERMAELGGRVAVPTTMNAISVDHAGWRHQGVLPAFGGPAARLADVYVEMGCRPTFTCAPYLLPTAPQQAEVVAWAESNAVVYANSILGARTAKHPDFLDLCIALTGRAALTGAYLDDGRRPAAILEVKPPEGIDDALWPLLGYLAGQACPSAIPLLTGLKGLEPSPDDLKALCAAFGTMSSAPMLHIAGITPEAYRAPLPGAPPIGIDPADFTRAWRAFQGGADTVDLVAIGSPHASLAECSALADALERAQSDLGPHVQAAVVVTTARHVVDAAKHDGTLDRLLRLGVQVYPDLCWCSMTEPLLPRAARTLMTNSGKYAHYGPGLSGRPVRFGSLAACAAAAFTGRAPREAPSWVHASSP